MVANVMEMLLVEYNDKTHHFNVSPLGELLANNRRAILGHGIHATYLPIGLVESREEANALIESFTKEVQLADSAFLAGAKNQDTPTS